MKIRISIKDTNLSDSFREEVNSNDCLSDERKEVIIEDFIEKYTRYGEYIDIEYDTDTSEVKIVEQ